VACEPFGEDLLGGEAAVGENRRADEGLRCLLDGVGAVVDGDRLQQHSTRQCQQVAALGEERAEVLPADDFDHLERDERDVFAGQVAVVGSQHGHAIAAWMAKPPHPAPISIT
jgi:hypothetical protein